MVLPWLFNGPAPGPIRHHYYGFPDENYLKTNDDILTLKAEHDFSPNLNVAYDCARGELSAAGEDYGAADLLECSAQRACGWMLSSSLPTSAYNTKCHARIRRQAIPATITW